MTGPLDAGELCLPVAKGCSHGRKHESWWLSLSLPSRLVIGGQGLLTGTAGLGRHSGQHSRQVLAKCWHGKGTRTVLTKRRSVGWMVPARCRFPRLGNPLVSSVELRRFVIWALGHSRLSRSYFPAPAFSHVVAGIFNSTWEYVLAVAAPALDRRALDTGPFLQDFFFLSPTSAFAMRGHAPETQGGFFLCCVYVLDFFACPCPCPPVSHVYPHGSCSSSPQKSCNAGRTLIAALRHSHNTFARRLLACTCTCNLHLLSSRPTACTQITHSFLLSSAGNNI